MRADPLSPAAITQVALPAPVNTLVCGRATPDTLRCSAWLDLTAGPIVLSVPDTWGRYYALWLRDARGRVFASIGARTTGTARGDFVVLGPGRHGAGAPAGCTPILAPTRTVQLAGRLEAVGETDAEAIRNAHEGFRLSGARTLAPAVPPPVASSSVGTVSGWTRAGDDPAADVLHLRTETDADARPLSGAQRYVLRFAPDAAPPVNGFWELTAGERSTGDRHPLALDVDGALDVHIQHAPPARARRWNWLPAPTGPFSLALHLYWPRTATWAPPPVRPLQ